MKITFNHKVKGLVTYENVEKFETSNNSYMIYKPESKYSKNRIEKEKIASFSVID